MCWFLGNDADDIIKYSASQNIQKTKKEINPSTNQNREDLMIRINRQVYSNQLLNKVIFYNI